MGVSAIFVSNLALTRLPTPNDSNLPNTQQDVLATVLPVLVSFTVLGSILIRALSILSQSTIYSLNFPDGLSIPLYSVCTRISGRHRTLSMSRTSTNETTVAPDWQSSTQTTSKIPISHALPASIQGDVEHGVLSVVDGSFDAHLERTQTE